MEPAAPRASTMSLESEEGLGFLRLRIRLLAKLSASIACFFLVFSNVLHLLLIPDATFRAWVLQLSNLIQLVLTLIPAAIWLVVPLERMGRRGLAGVDAGMTLSMLGGMAWSFLSMTIEHFNRFDLLAQVSTVMILTMRATLIPSRPRVTFLVSAVGSVPVTVVAAVVGARLARSTGEPSQLPAAIAFSLLFSVAGVAIAAMTSKVIYGLRAEVSEARRMGQYVLERKIGAGGMGAVYLARHSLLRRPTAIKLLPPEQTGTETIARFEREVQQTSLLTHPNTVAIFDYGRTADGIFYYAMEYLEGFDLQKLVERFGPQPASRVVHILAQACGALAEAHARGLVHRDIKPANIILCDRGDVPDTVKVLDFGLVKEVGAKASGETSGDVSGTDINTIVGTPAYLPPEAISTHVVDARSDLYALGAVGYFLLTGHPVFSGKTIVEVCASHLHEKPIRPSERLGEEVPRALEDALLHCLEKKPEARPASAAALRATLLACGVPAWSEAEAKAFWAEHATDDGSLRPGAEASGSRSMLAIDLGKRTKGAARRAS